ncbi:hypothetical protein KDW_37100 [Dictyobacter vulcani]|uniref:Uncharacterized protein n=1 Tax=Dictyobacter vulcani TaxID=2607529 RepID=A0A5J4KID5_9CHLR|nr:hypothetical protein KDW_37100 [Dictyobacter vulcani]
MTASIVMDVEYFYYSGELDVRKNQVAGKHGSRDLNVLFIYTNVLIVAKD